MGKTYNPSKYANTVQGAAAILVDPRSSAANQYFGTTNIVSATNVVSTTVVKSDSMIFATYKSLGTSLGLGSITVQSVVAATCFTLVTSIGASSGAIFWEIKNVR